MSKSETQEPQQNIVADSGPDVLRSCPHCGKRFALRLRGSSTAERCGGLVLNVYQCRRCGRECEFLPASSVSPWWLRMAPGRKAERDS